MIPQERRFTLAEVHTKMGTMGEVTFDQPLLVVLGVRPGDTLIFTISTEGEVTVKGEKKALERMPTKLATTPPGVTGITPSEVTQPALFDSQQTHQPSTKRRGTS